MTEYVVSREAFSRRIWRKTWHSWGARLGFAWIAVLVLMGVFAPFLANSMPLLMSKDGQISAPVLHYLTAEDVIVLVMFGSVLVLAAMRLSAGKRVLTFLGILLVTAIMANAWVKPPHR